MTQNHKGGSAGVGTREKITTLGKQNQPNPSQTDLNSSCGQEEYQFVPFGFLAKLSFEYID